MKIILRKGLVFFSILSLFLSVWVVNHASAAINSDADEFKLTANDGPVGVECAHHELRKPGHGAIAENRQHGHRTNEANIGTPVAF